MSYKYNSRLSSSPKVVGVHLHEHSSSNSQRNQVKGAIKIKQRTTRSSNIRLQQDFDGFSDSSDSTNCSELSNASNNINSYHQNRKNSVNSYNSGRSLSNTGTIPKRSSIKRTSLSTTDRPPIPIKNNNIMKKMSIDSSNYDIPNGSLTGDNKLLAISINDQANDRALRKIMDLEILNESLRSINESLECTIKEQNLKMEQLQLQIDHLKSASTLNSTTDDDLLFDLLLNKDDGSEIKIIPRHPQHANKDNSSEVSSSIPQQKEVENLTSILENSESNEDIDVQFKRICAKLDFLINDATKAIELKPKEIEKELNKDKKPVTDPNDIKIERRHSNATNNESQYDKSSNRLTDSTSTLVEEEEESISISNSNSNDDINNSNDLTKIEEEVINEKTKSEKEVIDNDNNELTQKHLVVQSVGEIQTKYKKVFNIIEQLNSLSEDVMNETAKFDQSQSSKDSKESQNDEKSKTTNNFNSNKGLAMLLNPLINNNNSNNNDKNASPESSTNKIKELASSMNRVLSKLMDTLNEEKQKEIKQSEEQSRDTSNNNIRCPIVITTGPPDKPNKSGFNRRNSSVTSPNFNRTSSVERTINVGNDVFNNEGMKKINAILNSNGNVIVNSPGYPSILSSIPFKKENKLFHRTRTWDPQYLNHYRSLSVQTPSSLRNVKSPSPASSMNTNINNDTSSNNNTNDNNNTNNNNNITSSTTLSSSPTSITTTSTSSSTQIKSVISNEEMKFQTFVQGLERKKTHLPSFYL
ncbi:hypothetical protein BCR36DRAFT_407153 [Piromyces finnis]|uniref:Uncharacterized protein n=1 Tax=Piromyces finnis TaxID=1754191 RepID=A0A1Y1UW17_9FUNG|nr:hypothetical protein BCR36DRAFT_407153 [Piromyces finnis]|eukprot:ORX42138.1 hypothetical protein BCR36DRAFT_407153 [Piromyces finnis]